MKRTPRSDAQLLEQMRLRAVAIEHERRREGEWSGGVVPHVEYQKKPIEWMTEYLGIPEETLRWSMHPAYEAHTWDGDEDPLVQLLEGLANWEDVGVESATGTGKTFLAACITYWFIACFEDAIVSTIAPKESQLLQHIWKEMGKLWPRFHRHFPEAEFLTGVLRMKPAVNEKEVWAATAFVCGVGASEESATKAQGLHAEHMLIITEETTGIHHAIMNALFNTRTDDHNLHLALGNPDHQQDELHRFCQKSGVKKLRISAYDHPNVVTGERVVPGAIGLNRLAKRIEDLGEGTRLYMSRIRGLSPPEAEDALIRREWCLAAVGRFNNEDLRDGQLALGVDVADSPTGDCASIARWQGACLTEVISFKVKVDAREVGMRVVKEARDPRDPVDPRFIGIDSVGVGASAVNEIRRLGMKVRHISGGSRANPVLDVDAHWSVTEPDLEGSLHARGPKVVEAEEYNNLRSQVWWKMRTDLRLGRIALPDDPELLEDLCTPTYTTRGGKICVESKEDIIKRLRRSPDKGDAACYGNFVRHRKPTKRKATEEEMKVAGYVVPTRNRDIGLERLLERHRKRMKREEGRIRRRMAGRF